MDRSEANLKTIKLLTENTTEEYKIGILTAIFQYSKAEAKKDLKRMDEIIF